MRNTQIPRFQALVDLVVRPRRLSGSIRYGLPVVLTLAVLAIGLPLGDLAGDRPFAATSLFFVAILLVSWYSSLGSGLMMIALAAVTTQYFFVEPRLAVKTLHSDDQLRLAAFVAAALVVQSFSGGVRRLYEDLRRSQINLADFMENAVVGLHWLGPDGSILWANGAEMQMLGYLPEEYLGHHIAEFHADQAVIDDILKRLGRGETIRDYAARLRAKDGRILDVLIDENVLWSEGRFIHTRCFTRDVTEKKSFETALSQSEQRYRSLVQATTSIVWSAAPEGDFVGLQPSWELFTGQTREEYAGWGWSQALHPDDRDRIRSLWAQAVRTGSPSEWEGRIRNAGLGQYRYFEAHAVPVLDSEGKIREWVGTCIDVTQGREAHEALRRSEERLQREHAKALELYESESAARLSAEVAVRRTASLQAAAAALVEARTTEDVGRAVLDELTATLGAARGWVSLAGASADGGLRPVVERDSRGADAPLDASFRIALELAAGERRGLFIPSVKDWEERFPDLEVPNALGAFVALPVMANDELLAVVGLGWETPREFPGDDVDMMFAFCRLASQALEKVRLYEAEQAARHMAELSGERIMRLQAVTAALGETMTQGEVAEVVLREGIPALRATAGLIALLDRAQAELFVAARRGFPKDAPVEIRLPLTLGTPLTSAVVKGRSVLVSDGASIGSSERLGLPVPEDERSWAVVPIIHNEEVFGALRLSWGEAKEFPAEEVELMETLARQTGQAFERARLYQSEQRARRVAEHSAFQMARLHAARSALATALTPSDVAEVVLREGISALQGVAGAISLASPDGGTLEVVAATGYPTEPAVVGSTFPREAVNPVTEAFNLLSAVYYDSAQAVTGRFPEIRTAKAALKTEGLACVPLAVEERRFGVLSIGFADRRSLSAAEKELIEAFADQAAQALDRARLYQAETDARRAAEAAAQRLRQLQLVTAALSEAVTPAQVETVFASRGVAAAGAWAGSIYLLSEDGRDLKAITTTGYPSPQEDVRLLPLERFPELRRIVQDSVPAFIRTAAEMPEEGRKMVAENGSRSKSWALVPTQHERRGTGLIVFSFDEEQPFAEAHKELLVTLSRQFGEALERARLYQAEHELRSRLNAVVSNIPGIVWEAWGSPDSGHQRIDFVSDYAETMLGYSVEEWLSTPNFWLKIVHPEDRERATAEAAAFFTSGEAGAGQFRWVCKDGRVIDVMTHCLIIGDATGRPAGMRAVALDITEKVRAESALRESEMRAESVLATVANGIITIDEAGVVESFNPAAERMFGYCSEEAVGRNVSMLMPPPYRDEHARYISDYLATGDPKIIGRGREVLGRRKDGSTFALELAVNEVQIGDRRIFTGIVNDISERKRVQEGIEFLAHASSILASSLDHDTTLKSLARVVVPAIADWCAIDIWEDGRIERVAVMHSDAAKIELARSLERRLDPETLSQVQRVLTEPSARLFREIPPSRFDAIADPERREVLRELGFRSAMIVPLVGRTEALGAITLVNAESNRLFDEQDLALAEELGRRAGMAVENARLYQESQRAQAELRRSNESKDEFLGLVSHELRTPITSIYGGARFLHLRASLVDEATRNELILTMQEESEKLYRLVENLLALARTELGREIPKEPVSIEPLAEKVARSIQNGRSGRIVTVADRAEGIMALGDSTYIEQVLQNLLSNADKYSPLEEPITVSIQPSRRRNELVVRVLDRGPGIDPEEINLVFESFYRSTKTSNKAPGKGLGLTVCKRLIEAQGGRIWARSRPGGGLEVGFALSSQESTNSDGHSASEKGASTAPDETDTAALSTDP